MEEKKFNKRIVFSIVAALLLIAVIAGATYAYFSATKSSEVQTVTTDNLSIVFDDGTQIINNSNIYPILSSDIKTKAAKKIFTVENTNNSSMMYLNILLDEIEIDEELKNKNFKWVLYELTSPGEDNTPVNSGMFKVVGSKQRLTTTILIENETKEYELYIYIEETGEDQNAMQGKRFSAKITVEGSTKLDWDDYPEIIQNDNMATQIFRNINVNAGEYYGYVSQSQLKTSRTDGEVLNVLLKTNDTTGSLSNSFVIRQSSSSNTVKYTTKATYQGDGYYLISHTYKQDEGAPIPYLLVDFRNSTTSIKIEYVYLGLNYVPEDTNGIKVAYVSPNGNDNNTGISENYPLLTFNEAIETGANIILAKPGEYSAQTVESIYNFKNPYILSSSLEIYPYEDNKFSNKKIIINNGEILENLAIESNGLLTTAYSGDSPTIWQIHESIPNDTILTKVESLENCISNSGSYYSDGNNIYINPYETDYKNFVVSQPNRFYFKNYEDITIKNLTHLYGEGSKFYTTNFVELINLDVRYAYSNNEISSGIAFLDSNGNVYDSIAYKNEGDGFNIHDDNSNETKFVANFYGCIGSYNYDDGISHHDVCSGEIIGGKYQHNVKGGIIPISVGQKVYVKNTLVSNNKYGLFFQGEGTIYNAYNVISKNNEYGIYVSGTPNVNTYNLTLEDNTNDSFGSYNSN